MWVLGLSRACAWPSNSSSAASYLREEHGRVSGVMWLSGCKLSGRDRGGASSTRHEHWWRNGESVSCLGRVSDVSQKPSRGGALELDCPRLDGVQVLVRKEEGVECIPRAARARVHWVRGQCEEQARVGERGRRLPLAARRIP